MSRDEAARIISASAALGEPLRFCALCWYWTTAHGWRNNEQCMACEGTGLRLDAATPAPTGGVK